MAKILILEDEPELSGIWQATLAKEGHEVSLNSSYDEFEESFQKDHIELMIVDLSLSNEQNNPEFTGLVALSDNYLRMTLRGQKIPCIVVSGYFEHRGDDDPLRQRVLPFSPDKVLSKPFKLTELVSAVNDLLPQPSP